MRPKGKGGALQAVAEAGAAQPDSEPSAGDSTEWDFAMGLLEVVPEPPERPTSSGGGPSRTERPNFKNPLNSNMAQNTNLEKHVRFKDSLNPKA